MNRAVVNFILCCSLVILAALLGLAGYKAYQRYVRVISRPLITMPAATMMLTDPEVTHPLRMTTTGVVVDLSVKNRSGDLLTKVTITDLQFDTFKAAGQPKTFVNIAPGATVKVTLPVPGLKSTSTSYESVKYDYSWKTGGGSGFTSIGVPPSPPPAKKPAKSPKKQHGVQV